MRDIFGRGFDDDDDDREDYDPAYKTAQDTYEDRNYWSRYDLLKMSYPEYLKTAHWDCTRRRALLRAGHQCWRCEATSNLDVHHRTYVRRGREEEGDLVVLCRSCHALEHGDTVELCPKCSTPMKQFWRTECWWCGFKDRPIA
jgi:5-methylcytosine-specific restriction endonuclease McrA